MGEFKRVVVDYGHGGLSPSGVYQTHGAKQYRFTGPDGFIVYEGVSNRDTAWRLMTLLVAQGIEVHDALAGCQVTKPVGFYDLVQEDVSLADRVNTARQLPASDTVFVSLHSNAIGNGIVGPSQSARGAAFYTHPGQTRSDHVASSLHDAFTVAFRGLDVRVRKGDWSDGDPDEEADFYVLRNTPCPAVLGEVLFFTNIDDARFLKSDRGQECIAGAYLAGLLPFLR